MSTHSHDMPVPRVPLWGAGLLVSATLVAVAAMRLSDVDISSRSTAPVVAERLLRFEDRPDGSIVVLDARGGPGETATVLRRVEPGSGGFLRGALRALARERRSAGLGSDAAFHLVARADGRLTLEDPATAQRVDLESFGPPNSAVFARLLADAPAPPTR